MNRVDNRCLSVAEAAARVGVGRTHLYEMLGAGQIRSIKIGRRRLVPEVEIDRFIARELGDDDA